jgi:Lon protease-like protein
MIGMRSGACRCDVVQNRCVVHAFGGNAAARPITGGIRRTRAGGQGGGWCGGRARHVLAAESRPDERIWRAIMPMNATYRGPGELPGVIPVFPLAGALLLPRGQMPLNIFEPRYLAMVDDALADRHRLIGMIQPDPSHPGPEARPQLYRIGCVGRITQVAESGDGRYLIELTGVSRFRVEQELAVITAYRQCQVTYAPYADDFIARKGEDAVDRKALLEALAAFLKANKLKADWGGIEHAPNEALVNALAMMSPYGAAEKQALLEAPDLKTRAEILVAVTAIEIAKGNTEGETPLQ